MFSLFDNLTRAGTALFEESVDILAGAGLSETVNTTNGDGLPATWARVQRVGERHGYVLVEERLHVHEPGARKRHQPVS